LGVGTLYRHFPTKDDLIAGIAAEMFGEVRRLIDEALAVDDPIESLRALLRSGLETVDRYGDLIEVLHSAAMPELKRQFDFDAFLARVAGIIQKGIDRGLYRTDLDPELVATLLISSLHPGMLTVLRRTHTLEQIVDGRLSLLLHGVCREPATGP
jgi:AcrR family transcriptional regulator